MAASGSGSSRTPRTTVTVLPPRPCVERETRTTPSPCGKAGAPQRQLASGWRHCGHMRPAPVEYTSPVDDDVFFMAGMVAGRILADPNAIHP